MSARASHTTRAAGMAGAQLGANALALAATVAFARALGTDGYGELARMVSVFTVLLVPASALQAATARDSALGRLGTPEETATTLRAWLDRVLLATAVAGAACALLREPLADLMQVSDPWGAALVVPAGVLWTGLALLRGVLQGARDYRPVAVSLVAEQGFRLGLGLAVALAGGGVTAIFAASVPVALVPVGLLLAAEARRRLAPPRPGGARTPLRVLARRNPAPVAALTLFAVVQNADVVAVAHELGSTASGAYAQAAVAAKAVIWVAVGLGLYLLPEATREAARGLDPRHLLVRTGGLLLLVALPMVAVYAVAAEPVLDLVFGDEADLAAGALPWLGAAMSLLGLAFLALQLQLGLGRRRFVVLVAAMAVATPAVVLLAAGTLRDVALALLVLDAGFLAGMLALALRPVRVVAGGRPPDAEDAEALARAEATAAAAEAIP